MALRSGYKGFKKLLPGLKIIRPGTLGIDNGVLIPELNKTFFPRSEQAILGAVNIMPNTAVSNGIFTVNADGSITINGTPSESVAFPINTMGKWLEDGKTYYLSGITGGAGDTYKLDIVKQGSGAMAVATDGEVSFVADNTVTYNARIVVYANKTVNTTIYPMVAVAPNQPYTPYAMTNKKLTEKVQGIINAATNAADFAAFKTAIGNL